MYRFPKMIVHLTAYKGTGKDTLFSNLHQLDELGWRLYASSDIHTTKISKPIRLAFADKLKMMVVEKLGLNLVEDLSTIHPSLPRIGPLSSEKWIEEGWLDKLKNIEIQGITGRQWLIDYGTELKVKYGKKYFVKLIQKDVMKKLNESHTVFITDTRFPYEIFCNSTTIRLFRSDIPIPDENDISERSMDKYKCSHVLCKDNYSFDILKRLQPQYQNYSYYGKLSEWFMA